MSSFEPYAFIRLRAILSTGTLVIIKEIQEAISENEAPNDIANKLLDNAFQVISAFAKYPNVEDEAAPAGYFDIFNARVRDVVEPISIELAAALRLFKEYQKATCECIEQCSDRSAWLKMNFFHLSCGDQRPRHQCRERRNDRWIHDARYLYRDRTHCFQNSDY